MPSSPAHPALSSTILLVRDRPHAGGDLLEVFMVERHHQIDFATGALVFPGGRIEPGDAEPGLRARCRGVDGLSDDEVSARVGAIRETYEECGVLLARPRGGNALVGAEQLAHLAERYGEELRAHALEMPRLVEAEDLELACDALVPFAHWITPRFMPKRFDTWFFLVQAQEDQLASHDGRENVDSTWITVAEARAARESGRRTIIFPTWMNLLKLGRSSTAAGALTAARSEKIVAVLPEVRVGDDGEKRLCLPPEAGYDVESVPLEGLL